MQHNAYTYVSSRACYDPAKTIFVFAPADEAKTTTQAQQFAERSGWQTLAEYDGAVLVVPVAANGWMAEDTGLPGRLFDSLCRGFPSRNGKSLLGCGGKLWCWETLVYIVGYDDGASFAGDCVVAAPNRFAAAALVGGAPGCFAPGEDVSSHWLVKQAGADYDVKNKQIASCVWMLGGEPDKAQTAMDYFAAAARAAPAEEVVIAGIPAQCRQNPENPAEQVLYSAGEFVPGIALSQAILNGLFDRIIRWKNGPDGTLKSHSGQAGFYNGSRFIQESICVDTLDYPYAIHLPNGLDRAEAQGLPLLFCLHGRGEPAWLFAEKNGWGALADETQEFVLAVPDSPGNIWQLERDGKALLAMVDKICGDYRLDKTRVYLTGFSNGAAFTREIASSSPQYFAAISPWNGPVNVPGIMQKEAIAPTLLPSGYELPYWVYVGDNDPVARPSDVEEQLKTMLAANHCAARSCPEESGGYVPDEIRTAENYYTSARGYSQGNRFCTRVYYGKDGVERVGYTVMKNMPHGAIDEQSKAAWEFMRRFYRPDAGRHVCLLP